ncbi:uncharacterized protein LOC127862954 [Dreissena polymorpha]|uniref:Uncharacterized protein n=1 Tax=Dreissena polymorpha TaxID=45954 RepID=A0A9D3YCB1_DREPO|nr:uncharacterized protein LOC127862954 [Dreissena polymorpha]XP_052258188.1 uncharacterized protein LOC127862954 [Dreissena polymorpha]KAH3695719.1 hypothetical protein DPMN_083177 [Dreissena polymorpha]
METLRRIAASNRAAILSELDLNKDILGQLSKVDMLNITECVKLQQTEDHAARNALFLDLILTKESDSVYTTLVECLLRSGQTSTMRLLMDVKEEMIILSQMQSQLQDEMKTMAVFLSREERRAGIYITEAEIESDNDAPAINEQQVWVNVQKTLKHSFQQLSRCKAVIEKLHEDCETVAKQNTDIVEQTKECDAKIKSVLSVGRKSAKLNSVPKKTQDLFGNLMDDIEQLVKTRRKVLDQETEGKRHSTRIVRQCRDWIEGRAVALQKLAAVPPPGTFRSFDVPGDAEMTVKVKRPAPPAPRASDNGIMSILDALKLLELELQDYIHKEVIVTDKYRSELRFKQLQRRIQGFNIHGISDVESALDNMEKEPEHFHDHLTLVKSCISEINREYSECLGFLNRACPTVDIKDPVNGTTNNGSLPKGVKHDSKPVPKNWPSNFKSKQSLGSKLSRSMDNNLQAIGREKTEPNQLLERLKSLVAKHDELKSEDLTVGNKYRAEMSKKKRDAEIVLQKKDDQIMRLQTDIKEAVAEMEKYKKLYNDTKIGFQRNHENQKTKATD